jgi:hypothetical protein
MTTTTTPIDRAEINRRNAQKSTGPRTPEGKNRSKFNALKHGMTAKTLVLPDEDANVLQFRLESWVADLQPQNDVEKSLVEQAVHASWRLDRANRAEAAQPTDLLSFDASAEGERLRRYLFSCSRSLFRSLATLIQVRRSTPGTESCSVVSVPCSVNAPADRGNRENEATDPRVDRKNPQNEATAPPVATIARRSLPFHRAVLLEMALVVLFGAVVRSDRNSPNEANAVTVDHQNRQNEATAVPRWAAFADPGAVELPPRVTPRPLWGRLRPSRHLESCGSAEASPSRFDSTSSNVILRNCELEC